MNLYLIRDRKPVLTFDAELWQRENVNIEARRVAITDCGSVQISTVFYGREYEGNGSLLLFETKVYGGKLDDEIERYSTWEEALSGHARMVERCNKN